MEKSVDYPWGTNRRYNALSDFFIRKFGGRVQKVSVNAGFTCPNRDGTKGSGGCSYCNNAAFSPSYCHSRTPVRDQIEQGIRFHKTRYPRTIGYLAYFQSYTNTYADVLKLGELYREALSVPGITGMVIGTRPDCVNDEILTMISEFSSDTFVLVEYGIESCNNKTLRAINRGHDFEASLIAVKKTAEYGIMTGGHIIFGLPGESRNEMLEQARQLSSLPLDTIKMHQLQIVKDTPMANLYKNEPEKFSLFKLDDYLDFLIEFIENLKPSLIIDRFSGEVPPGMIAGGERWGLRNDRVLSLFEQKLEKKGSWQGKYY